MADKASVKHAGRFEMVFLCNQDIRMAEKELITEENRGAWSMELLVCGKLGSTGSGKKSFVSFWSNVTQYSFIRAPLMASFHLNSTGTS